MAVLGSKIVMVLGHTACGAVKASMSGEPVPGQIGRLYPYIRPAVDRAYQRGVDAVVMENVSYQVNILRTASPVLAAGIKAGTVDVVGGMFDFRTGLVSMVGPATRAG